MRVLVDFLKPENRAQQDNNATLEFKIKVDTSELDAALKKVKEFNKELAKVSPPNNFVRRGLGELIIGKLYLHGEPVGDVTKVDIEYKKQPKVWGDPPKKIYAKNDLYIGMKVPYAGSLISKDLHWTITGFEGDFVYAATADGTFSNHRMPITSALDRLNQDCI